MLRAMFSRPLPLLLLVTGLFTFLIQSGELGTSDTTHRLQVTHSLWTGQPQVFPYEYPDFGVHGRGGRLYASYGIGQSLLMLPADLAGTAASRLPVWRRYVESGTDPTLRSIVVSITTNVLINVLTALAAYYLLCLLGFSMRASIAGTLGLLCATTHLHYAQNMTENNYILLLTLTGFALQYRWLLTAEKRFLIWGSIALGVNLLTRITTALDIVGAACFLLLAAGCVRQGASSEEDPVATVREGLGQRTPSLMGAGGGKGVAPVLLYLRTALPIYGAFLLLDRVYQYIRFGSWTTTYVSVLAREQRRLNPALPASYPFEGHWFQGGLNSGVLGPLFAPEKSLFLFDPLLPLACLLVVLLWRQLEPAVRALFAASLLLLVAYILFYGRYDSWGGDFAWGDRYLSSTVELIALLAVPLLLRYRQSLGRPVWRLGLIVIATSVAVQCASVAFWLPLELYQRQDFGRHTWIVFLRFKNIAGFALHRSAAWGLDTPAIHQDPWDAVHLTTWNVLPWLLCHVGATPLRVVYGLYGVWSIAGLGLIAASIRLGRSLRGLAE